MAKKFGLFGSRNPILGRGEVISEKARRTRGGGGDNAIRTFEETQQRLLPQLSDVIEQYSQKPRHLKLHNSAFFTVNIDSKFLAKSYFPGGVLVNHDLNIAGTRYWQQAERDGDNFFEPAKGRCVFVKTDISSIDKFSDSLQSASFNKTERQQLTRIDSITLEQVKKVNLPSDFIKGAAELIFHPMTKTEWRECRKKIIEVGFVDQFKILSELELQFYEEDIRFVPVEASRDLLERLNGFNSLRFARALSRIKVPEFSVFSNTEIAKTFGRARSNKELLNGCVPFRC